MKRIAVMGAGSLGMILGAFIAQAGRDVVLVDANEAHVKAMNEKGAKVVGNLDMVVPVKAVTPDQMEGVYDLFLYLAKQTYNDVAIPQMLAHSDENTVICTLQNGLPELAVCEAFGADRVLGAPVNWAGTWIEPGVSSYNSNPNVKVFALGSVTEAGRKHIPMVKEVLEDMGTVNVSDNLMGLRWTKVIVNATVSGMSASTGGTFGEVTNGAESAKAVAFIGRECIRCTKAEGLSLEHHHGTMGDFDFEKIFDFNDEESLNACLEQIKLIWKAAPNATASMLQDLQKGKACEIDAINGVVVAAGKRNGVPTPVNDLVVEVVKEKQAGKIPVDSKNLERFTALMDELGI